MADYDPEFAPVPEWWTSLEEWKRQELALESQRLADEDLPSPRAHAAIHVVVENQVAMGDEIPVAATLRRLTAEGLGRHDAVHAIGSVLASHVYRAMQPGPAAADWPAGPDVNEAYWRDLEALSAEGWRHAH